MQLERRDDLIWFDILEQSKRAHGEEAFEHSSILEKCKSIICPQISLNSFFTQHRTLGPNCDSKTTRPLKTINNSS